MAPDELRVALRELLESGLEIRMSEYIDFGPSSSVEVEILFDGHVVASDRFDLTNIDYPPTSD